MKTWQLVAVCLLVALVIAQGALISRLNDQIAGLQGQGVTNHTETLARITSLLTAQKQEETVLLTAFCANVRAVRMIAEKDGIPVGALINPPNAVGHVDVGGCRIALLPTPTAGP